MKIPAIRGVIERRILVNFRVDPDALKRVLPEPFRPKLIGDVGMAGSIFPSPNAASEFFKRGSLGYSPASKPGTFDGIELRSVTWHVEPLGIARVESSFFENQDIFPPGSVEFDCALLMRDIAHDWLARESVCSEGDGVYPALA